VISSYPPLYRMSPSFPSPLFLFSVCVFSVLFALFFFAGFVLGANGERGRRREIRGRQGGWMGTKYAIRWRCILCDAQGWVLRVERNQPWPGFRGYMFFSSFLLLFICLSIYVSSRVFIVARQQRNVFPSFLFLLISVKIACVRVDFNRKQRSFSQCDRRRDFYSILLLSSREVSGWTGNVNYQVAVSQVQTFIRVSEYWSLVISVR
jgi:hypothetical protein